MQEYIFILLSQTGTKVSKFIQLFTKKPYNHASVALDFSLEEIYSFCRTSPHRPLPATFNQEIVGEGTFGLFSSIPCEIYAIPLTAEAYRALSFDLDHYNLCRAQYSYNLLGLCTTFLHIRWIRQYKLHCAQFVARVLSDAGVQLEKPPCLYTPDDLRYLSDAHLVYRGELNRFYARASSRCELPNLRQHSAV